MLATVLPALPLGHASPAFALGPAVPALPGNAGPALPLGHAGRWITDSRGRVVVLHGANMVYKVAPYYPQAAGFGDDDAAFLARMGFNAVRVGVIWKALEPRPGGYDNDYLAHIASTVATLARHGIVSLLDFHQDMYNERFQGEGFPNWSAQDDGLAPEPKRGFGQNYVYMPALQRAYDHFWANSRGPGGIGLQDRFAAAWRHVAERFRGNANVLGYELMNEPWPGTSWQPCIAPGGCPAFDAALTAFYRRVIRAIRAVDRRKLVWYEPNMLFNSGVDTNLGELGDARAGFAFHDYCSGGSFTTCASAEDLVVANALRRVLGPGSRTGTRRGTGDALLMTEFGDSDYSLLSAMVRRDDRSMIPWLEWSYCPCHDPTGAAQKNALVENPARRPVGANLNVPALRILVEPYPRLVFGTPLSWGFDATARVFRFSYSTARASGGGRFPAGSITAVATPAFVYRGRYSVRVSGAAIVSRPGAGELVLASCRGARTVSLTVRPLGRSHPPRSRPPRSRGWCRPPARPARRPARRAAPPARAAQRPGSR
jgi:endoglycosylceramidase